MLRARLGIRTRILAIAVIPSLTLLGIGVGTAGYLVREGQHAKDWASILGNANVHTREMIAAVEQERMLSLWHLAGEHGDPAALGAARTRVDNALQALAATENKLMTSGSNPMGDDTGGFETLKKQLPAIRGGIDAGALPIPETYAIYNRILDAVVVGTNLTIPTAPDAAVAQQLAGGLRTLHAMEGMSRSAALTAAELNGQILAGQMRDDYRNLVGYYRTELPQLAADLTGPPADKIKTVIASPAWQQLAAMEDYLIHPPAPNKNGELPPPPMSFADWRTSAEQLGDQLLAAWQYQNDHANQTAVDDGDRTATNSLWAGAGVLAIAIIAFLLSLWLANRLIGRLKRLRTETLALAEVRLPETMRRLSEGENVDPEIEAARLDFGHDEIGSVANAFNRAHTAAVAAAVTEARTREGVRAVFLNIAHRSQIVVHRQLEILDEAEQRQEDPALLETFFRLDHLATRERRNAENLIILGGGEPGRQWRRPVPLVELVRSAIGETLDYARVRAHRMPQVFIVGNVVADLIHLLAELVDNATSFSPPQSRVEVSSNVVGKGVAIEISDQGMGMPADELERANEMLRNPPDFGVATLSANSRLGLFVVAQLGARHGITVRLSESDYGGIRAIVLVPTAVVAADAPLADHLPERFAGRRPEPAMTGEMPAIPAAETTSAATSLATLSPPQPQAWSDYPRTDSAPRTDDRSWADTPARREAPPRHELPATPTDQPARRSPQRPSYTGSDARPPLPRRRRQASLAPELAHDPQPDAASPQRPRSAEQARDLMSAIENGTRQGRRSQPGPTPDEQEGEGDFFQRR
ncbi:sensor histidine kinase [Nocardia nova]|uniref:sensor histidine kinase n=2 Tax=Nocardia nova TaxID=37330 RepID=UPI00189626ED|nr:sensor histidine kinase [Nocardia nova]MBF6146225.1 nitrate- and nitrite sensing domain-containing protein [Nocardia nova]